MRSFRSKAPQQLFDGKPRGIEADLRDKVEHILALLQAAESPQSMDLPSLRLHALRGGRKGTWAVTVNKNWRITFRFEEGHACGVDFEDYH